MRSHSRPFNTICTTKTTTFFLLTHGEIPGRLNLRGKRIEKHLSTTSVAHLINSSSYSPSTHSPPWYSVTLRISHSRIQLDRAVRHAAESLAGGDYGQDRVRGRTFALRVRETSNSNEQFERCWCQGLPIFGFLSMIATLDSKAVLFSSVQG